MAGLATRQGRAGVFRVVRLLSRLWRRPPIASAAFFRPPGICEAHWYYSGNAKYSRDWVQLLGAAGVVARLDTGKAFVDIGDEAETPHLAVGDDIDAAFSLLANHVHDRACNAARKTLGVKRLAPLLGLDHLQTDRAAAARC